MPTPPVSTMCNLLLKQSAQSEKRPDHKRRQFFDNNNNNSVNKVWIGGFKKNAKIIDSSERKDKN